jgi:hypothetical protein
MRTSFFEFFVAYNHYKFYNSPKKIRRNELLKDRMIIMRYLFALLTLLLVLGVIITIVPAAPDQLTDNNRSVSVRSTQVPRVSSGEVEYPITQLETPGPTISRTPVPTPTIPRTTISAPPTTPQPTVSTTQTMPVTTNPVTQTTPVPVVTVTVFGYPSGNVYQPVYYYPPGYPYYINSYYPTGTLTVTSNPSGATVILDGYNSEITPWIFTGLTTGYHTVEVDYPGYQAYVTNVYVDNGANPEINADLTGLVNYGALFIDSTPQGADVYVDGNYEGTSPVTVSAMAAGPHQVELHRAGYDVLTSTQYVTAGQATVATLVLSSYSSSSGMVRSISPQICPGPWFISTGPIKDPRFPVTRLMSSRLVPVPILLCCICPGIRILPRQSTYMQDRSQK